MTDLLIITMELYLQAIPPKMFVKNKLALILVQNQHKQIILAQKKTYPKELGRIVGGGIEIGEDPHIAAVRELNEELLTTQTIEQLVPLAQLNLNLTDSQGQKATLTDWLFFTQVDDSKISANDDVDSLLSIPTHTFVDYNQKFLTLPKAVDPTLKFAWSDWGNIYYQVQKMAFQTAQSKKLV